MYDWFYLQGVLVLILQVAAVVHVLRTGRAWWWIPVVFFFPWLGLLAYGIVELLPALQGRTGGRSVPFGTSSGTGRESVSRLARLADESPTVENQMRLAAALLRKGETDRAVKLYESCLDGVYAQDKTLWYELAEAYHANGQAEDAAAYLRKLEEAGFRDYRDRRALLMALALEKLGQPDESLRRLEHLVATFPGQEANFHFARLLFAQGEEDKGRIVVEGMLARKRSHDARYRRREGRWYAAAKKLLG